MAILLNKKTQQSIILRGNHTFGRDAKTNITALQSLSASRNHAFITWDNDGWKIKDTSSNGTYLYKTRLGNGCYHELELGDTIQFGHQPCDVWSLVDASPPITGLIPLSADLTFIPLHDVHILSIEQADIMLYLGEEGRWICETANGSAILSTSDKVGSNGKFWQFVDERPCATTAMINVSPPPDDIKFLFKASQNEEHISLSLVIDNTERDLGERSHHYVLLMLAKQRIEDIKKGMPVTEQGWIKKDVLVQMIGMGEQHINIHIYRFRQQVTKLLPHYTTLHHIIERRPGELRFSYSDLNIEGGFNDSVRYL